MAHRIFDLLLLQEHLCCRFEFFVLKQAIDQFGSRIVFGRWSIRIARQQHLRLNVNEYRGHINKVGSDVHVQLSKFFDICQILSRDSGNRDVVDIDILLANQVEQKVERAFVNVTDSHRKREIALCFFLLLGLLLLGLGQLTEDRLSRHRGF